MCLKYKIVTCVGTNVWSRVIGHNSTPEIVGLKLIFDVISQQFENNSITAIKKNIFKGKDVFSIVQQFKEK